MKLNRYFNLRFENDGFLAISVLSLLYVLSLVSFTFYSYSDLFPVFVAAITSLMLLLLAIPIIGLSEAEVPVEFLILEKYVVIIRRLWLLTMLAVLFAILDLTQAIYYRFGGDLTFTLGELRGAFFEDETFRSLAGRVFGSFFLAFASLGGLLFRVTGKVYFISVTFLLAAVFSLLMGGRGQILLAGLVLSLPIIFRKGIFYFFLSGSAFVVLLGVIYVLRSPEGSSSFIVTIYEYLATPWFGFSHVISDWPFETVNLRFGSPDLLESHSFSIFGSRGNVYSGPGQIIYSYGLIGGIFYFAFLIFMAICVSLLNRNIFSSIYLQQLYFCYFAMLIWHDLVQFYFSFILAILVSFLISLSVSKVVVAK